MLTINVAPDGSGQFTTISEAVLAVPYDCSAVIRIAPGIYREKLVCEKKDITLAGAGMDATRLVWNDGGKLPHPDGRPTHTFRSYTAFFSGEKLRVEDMTIENDAGPGAKAGQAIAAYVDSARAAFSRVRLLGNQDTLFCAPLPEKEREKDGFLGPRGLAPRRASAQYYHACEIAGDIDFIFGGADALFEHCTLRTVDNGLAHSWVTAPSGAADGLGFVRCWIAALGRILRQRALPAGTTAPTRRWPALPKQAAPARAQGSAPAGYRRFRLLKPLRCCALPGRSAAWRLRKG